MNECLELWNSVDEISLEKLPNQFVLKPTNDSGDVVLCEDKNRLDWEKAKKRWLRTVRGIFLLKPGNGLIMVYRTESSGTLYTKL